MHDASVTGPAAYHTALTSHGATGSSFLMPESLNETIKIGDGDGERRMPLSPDWRRNRLTEMDADSRGPIGPKR